MPSGSRWIAQFCLFFGVTKGVFQCSVVGLSTKARAWRTLSLMFSLGFSVSAAWNSPWCSLWFSWFDISWRSSSSSPSSSSAFPSSFPAKNDSNNPIYLLIWKLKIILLILNTVESFPSILDHSAYRLISLSNRDARTSVSQRWT